jgi:gamma-glutamyltranspeptidase/glutathione hydrolase
MRQYLSLPIIGLVLSLSALAAAEPANEKSFARCAVASVNPLATQAGVEAIRRGGNAVDAAIATALTLGVVDGHNSGIGGGCFILIRAADGTFAAIDGRETAPAAARRDLYVIGGRLDEGASKTGALASGVPGALAAYELALEKFGKLKLADLLLPAADLAEKGFPIDEMYARKIEATAPAIRKFPASAAILLRPDGAPRPVGEVLVQKDLATTYRAIAKEGLVWFYHGAFAEKTAAWMQQNGGLMTAEDFANYAPEAREPIHSSYRKCELISMPPPSSGGVHVAQILNMLEHFPLREFRPAARIHVITEAMKLAFADRAFWLGDPAFTEVPRGLVDARYAAELAAQIDLTRTTPVAMHHTPPRWEGDVFGKHTTHLSTADAEGNWVAMTQTINTAFGSKVVVPGTGVLLNNEMDDFSIQPGVPNSFGLIGAEANAIAPGKRPLSSMSPTIVLRDGHPILSIGAAGGPTIITQTLLAITHFLDDGMTPAQALAEPRFHHQWQPDSLRIETSFGAEVLGEVERLGHVLEKVERFGATQCVAYDPATQRFTPAHDPRVPGGADGL